ncbi:hypothetical protein [Streptomyces sp. NPDC053755]|uniref:hypothetical protein n=1 Tax=Streptomyces sp. NPDC053755 TaxID=3155815 RepID=UPI00341F15CF
MVHHRVVAIGSAECAPTTPALDDGPAAACDTRLIVRVQAQAVTEPFPFVDSTPRAFTRGAKSLGGQDHPSRIVAQGRRRGASSDEDIMAAAGGTGELRGVAGAVMDERRRYEYPPRPGDPGRRRSR